MLREIRPLPAKRITLVRYISRLVNQKAELCAVLVCVADLKTIISHQQLINPILK